MEHTVPLHNSYNLYAVCECTLWAECAQYLDLLPLTDQTSHWSLFVSAWWCTIFAALLGLPLVSGWRCFSFRAWSVRFLTQCKWQFLWQIGFTIWQQNPAVQNGQFKEMKDQFFHPFESTAIHQIANFHSVCLVDIPHMLVANFSSGWFSFAMFIWSFHILVLDACLSYAYNLLYHLSQVSPDFGLYVMLFHFLCLTSEVLHAHTVWIYSTTTADFHCECEVFPVTCHDGTEGK